jgi:4-amino-4-deoxy-L-arabinose transferase-like glycosyltransferase
MSASESSKPSAAAFQRPRLLTLGLVLLLAAGLRVFAWSRATMMMNDGPDFLWQAQRLLEGDWAAALSHPYHPLYAGLIAGLSWLGVETVHAAVGVSIGGALALVVATWGLTRIAFPAMPRAPAAAALVAAITSRFITYTSDVQSEGLYVGLAGLALWACMSAAARDGCKRRLALAGLLTGLTYLTRPEGLFLCLPFAIWLAASPWRLPRRLAGVAAFAFGLLAVSLPYVLAMHSATGIWGLSLKPSLQFSGLTGEPVVHLAPASSPMGWGEVPRAISPRALRRQQREQADLQRQLEEERAELPEVQAKDAGFFSFDDPPTAPTRAPRSSWGPAASRSLALLAGAMRPEFGLLAILGCAALLRHRRRLGVGLMVALLGWLALTAVHLRANDYMSNRHSLMAMVMLVPVTGAGLLALWDWHLLTRMFAILCLLVGLASGVHDRRKGNEPRLQALAWVAENTQSQQGFATHRRRDGWYAGRFALVTRMPCRDIDLKRQLERRDIPYLVFDEHKLQRDQPKWLEQGLVEEVARFGENDDTVLVLSPRF